jgi:hypothetical protein
LQFCMERMVSAIDNRIIVSCWSVRVITTPATVSIDWGHVVPARVEIAVLPQVSTMDMTFIVLLNRGKRTMLVATFMTVMCTTTIAISMTAICTTLIVVVCAHGCQQNDRGDDSHCCCHWYCYCAHHDNSHQNDSDDCFRCHAYVWCCHFVDHID